MATTKIWTIHEGSDIRQVLDYVANDKKTTIRIETDADTDYTSGEKQQLQDLIDYAMAHRNDPATAVLAYAANDNKTEERRYISGINCSPEHARDEMMLTKLYFHKTDRIILWHGYQSFKPGEVTPEEAHEIGVKLAESMWGDYEVLVCTHLDKAHIHNHFVINSVSFKTGKKLDVRWADMARESDRLCRLYGKSVIYEKQARSLPYGEYRAKKEGRPTWTEAAKQDVDDCILESRSMQEFFQNLKERGYRIKDDRKYFTVKPPGKDRYIRLDRRLGEQYMLFSIAQRIEQVGGTRLSEPRKPVRKAYAKRSRYKFTGYQALYIRYCYMLGCFPKKPSVKKVHYLYREELIHMHRITEETQFLIRYKIETAADLKSTEWELALDLDRYRDEKKHLSMFPETDREERENYLSKKIKETNRNLFYCGDIRERSGILKEKDAAVRGMEKEETSQWKEQEKQR